jgi:hypothetical protein
MRRPLGAFLAVGLMAPLAPAAEPPAVDGLVARLGDDSFAAREAASRELLRLGPAALDTLAAAARVHPDAEVRRRAADLAEQLRRAVDSARLLTSKTVKLDYRGVPLGTAVADLRTKTGVPVTLSQEGVADPMRPVTVRTGELSPWAAVEAFRQAAGLHEVFRETLSTDSDEPASVRRGRRVAYSIPGQVPPATAGSVPVVLADGLAAALPGDRSTAVRVLALPASFPGNRVIRGAGEVVLNLDVTPLPGVKWDDVAAVRVLRAEDETGRPVTASHQLEVQSPGGGPYQQAIFLGGMPAQAVFLGGDVAYSTPFGQTRTNPRVVPVTLRTDDRAIRSLRVFEGVVVGEITLTDQALATVSNLSKSAGATVTGPNASRFTLLDYKELPDGRVSLKLRTEGPNPWTLQRLGRRGGLVFNNLMLEDLSGVSRAGRVKFKFTDAAGRPIPQPMTQSSSTTDDGIRQTAEVELVFAKRPEFGPPATLTVVGNKPATVEVPFRMTNVVLP